MTDQVAELRARLEATNKDWLSAYTATQNAISYSKMLEIAEDALSLLEAHRWVPVSEKPTKTGYYLVQDHAGDMFTDRFANGLWSMNFHDIVSWCELPAPYQPKESAK